METSYRIVRAGSAWLLAAMVTMFVTMVSFSTPAQAQPAPRLPEVCATFAQPVVVHIEHDVPLRKVAAAVWEGYDEAQASASLNDDGCGIPRPRALNALPGQQPGINGMSLRAMAEMSPSMFNQPNIEGVCFISVGDILCAAGNERAFEAHYALVRRVPVDAGVVEEEDDAGAPVDAGFVREEERETLHLDCGNVRRNPTEPRHWFREVVPHHASIYIGARRGHNVVLPRGGIARPTELACRSLATLADNSADETAITALQRALRDQEPVDASVRAIAVTRITNVALDLARRLHTHVPGDAFQPLPQRVETRVVYVYRDDPNLRSKASTLISLLLLALSLAVVLAGAAVAFWLEKRDVARELVSTTEVLDALAASVMKLLPPDDVRLRSFGGMTIMAAGCTALEALPGVVAIITSARRKDKQEIERLQRQLNARHRESPPDPVSNNFIIPPAPNAPNVGPGELLDESTSVDRFPFGDLQQSIGDDPNRDVVECIVTAVLQLVYGDTEIPESERGLNEGSLRDQLTWVFWVLSDLKDQIAEAREWHAFWHRSYEELAAKLLSTLLTDDDIPRTARLDPVGRHTLVGKILTRLIADAQELSRQRAMPPPPIESTRPIHRPGHTPSTPPVPSAPPDPVAPGDDTK